MATPIPDQIRSLIERHVQYWNEGRFDDWVALFPDGLELEDPVGTPVRTDRQSTLVEPWNHSQPNWRLEITNLVVIGDEVAMTIRNTGTIDGNTVQVDSIEFLTFGDGSLRWRVFYEPFDTAGDRARRGGLMDDERRIEIAVTLGVDLAGAARMSSADAAIPSCPGWTMRDLVEHVATEYAGWYYANLTIPPDVEDPMGPTTQILTPFPDEFADLVDYVERHARRFGDHAREVDLDLDTWVFNDVGPARFWLRQTIMEVAIHVWDAAMVAGRASPLTDEISLEGIDQVCVMQYHRGQWWGDPWIPPSTPCGLVATDADASWLMYEDAGRAYFETGAGRERVGPGQRTRREPVPVAVRPTGSVRSRSHRRPSHHRGLAPPSVKTSDRALVPVGLGACAGRPDRRHDGRSFPFRGGASEPGLEHEPSTCTSSGAGSTASRAERYPASSASRIIEIIRLQAGAHQRGFGLGDVGKDSHARSDPLRAAVEAIAGSIARGSIADPAHLRRSAVGGRRFPATSLPGPTAIVAGSRRPRLPTDDPRRAAAALVASPNPRVDP